MTVYFHKGNFFHKESDELLVDQSTDIEHYYHLLNMVKLFEEELKKFENYEHIKNEVLDSRISVLQLINKIKGIPLPGFTIGDVE